MKTGTSLSSMVAALERQANSKADFVGDTRTMEYQADSDTGRRCLVLNEGNTSQAAYEISDHASRQIATRLGIPTKYFDRMQAEAPELLEENVNTWFQKKPERRMVRTLDGQVRAFLSDRYRRIDNYDVFRTIYPILQTYPDLQIQSCQLTETRMYVKAVFPRTQTEVVVGDPVQAGVVISNSEVGLGSLQVEPLIFRLVCLNGMISPTHGVKRRHIGAHVEGDGEGVTEIFRDATLEADDKALMMKLEDVVRAASDDAQFALIVQSMRDSKDRTITDSPVKAVERLANKVGLNDSEQDGVLMRLIEGHDMSQYGLLNAITAQSVLVEDYDRATELERLGGEILNLNQTEWNHIAMAA